MVNSESFLAVVFHLGVRLEGPRSGFENSSSAVSAGGGAGAFDGVWVQVCGSKLGPRGQAQVGGPKCRPLPSPSGWAQAGTMFFSFWNGSP